MGEIFAKGIYFYDYDLHMHWFEHFFVDILDTKPLIVYQ